VYKYIVHRNIALSHYFRTTLQLYNLPVNCARELPKPSKDLAGLPVCNDKNLLGLGFRLLWAMS